jgi:hypothetical protein
VTPALLAAVLLLWDAPVACDDGQPVTVGCPVTAYLVDHAAAEGGPWSQVASTPATSHEIGTPAGCWRVRARAATGTSPPSNTACAGPTQPMPPGQPQLTALRIPRTAR